jgi:2-succinyl-5-enolpyruvyl-6-hydroxy-3-cyclohexene-1-carboxylate synthase
MGIASAPNANYAFCAAFFEELARAGVEHVCISPGSRSTPLCVSALREPGLTASSHIDERSAAFFALGLAKASRKPVALVATSGTAPANYFPAIVEAHHARVPLLVLSADRPAELRDWGAGQSIDQLNLYGTHTRWFAEVPLPEADARALHYARALAGRAVGKTLGNPPGPVQLNWPLREPLAPDPESPAPGDWGEGVALAREGRAQKTEAAIEPAIEPAIEAKQAPPYLAVSASRLAPDERVIAILAERARETSRGVIACGPIDAGDALADAVTRLAARLGWPVLAEPTSQLRAGAHVDSGPICAGSDLYLRDPGFARNHRPDFVLRIGHSPVSKAFRLWLEAAPPDEFVLVDPGGEVFEPSHLASRLVAADPVLFCRRLGEVLGDVLGDVEEENARASDWLRDFERAEDAVRRVLESRVDAESALFEPRATREVCASLDEGAILYVSNSMPIRDLDAFMPAGPRALRVLCNRGANGIDGMVSSALGAAAADVGHVVLLTGDLAFLHDLGGLMAARRLRLSATIVVLNNDGGGIFSFLPIASHGEDVGFEEFFATPHGLDLEHAAQLFGLGHTRVDSWDALRSALEKEPRSEGVTIVEVPVDRDANLAHFRAIVAEVAAAVSADQGDGAST